jgi:uncharacterized membrane protein YdbT with pleckstrin-like domain
MRHNLPVPNEQPAEEPNGQLTEQPIRRWRCPTVVRAESLVLAAVGVTVALVFFPLWFAIPVAVVLTAWYGGIALAGVSAAVDQRAGLLVFRVGLLVRRVRLTDISAVLVDQGKISIARTAGVEISLLVWGNSRLHRWLHVHAVATDVGHAIASAVALAQDGRAQDGRAQDGQAAAIAADSSTAAGHSLARAGKRGANRSTLASVLLGLSGTIAIVAALLVRVHWHNPAMTVLAVILALVLGISGLLYLLLGLWILLTGRTGRTGRRRARRPADRASAA